MQNALTNCNKILVECAKVNAIETKKLEENLVSIHSRLPEKHHLQTTLNIENVTTEFCTLKSEDFIWKFSFVFLLDHPFSWIDYPPTSKAIVFEADYQVWAHLDQLLHLHPLCYSWISSIFLGSFHKLANLHDKLMKRYGKFHLEKHAAAFLDSPSACKGQYLLSMKDFDVVAGITELLLAYLKYENEDNDYEAISINNAEIEKVQEFCKKLAKYQPELNIIANYLFEEGLSVLGLLEAQKHGDFDLDMLFTKIIIPLKFTARGVNYGPALCHHIRDMELLRPFEETAIKTLWVSNKSSEPGHCRPQDQNLEASFNNSTKNCFKLGTVQNVLNKASMIQEREQCHSNLKEELHMNNFKATPSKHQFRADSFIRLRACWCRGLSEIFERLHANTVIEDFEPTEIDTLHSNTDVVNLDLSNV